MQELLACLLNKLEAMVGVLTKHGFEPLQEAYLQAWLHSNQQVQRIDRHVHTSAKETTNMCAVPVWLHVGQLRPQQCCEL